MAYAHGPGAASTAIPEAEQRCCWPGDGHTKITDFGSWPIGIGPEATT